MRTTRRAETGLRAAVLAALVLVGMGSACTTLKRLAYEGFERDRWQKPDEVAGALALPPRARVADLGSGGGYFTFRLADAVGPLGLVYAVDVDEDLNRYVEETARGRGYENVRVVLARFDDALLPQPVDLIFTCNTYHHLEDRSAYFERARRYLRPGGRLAVVEYRDVGLLQRLFSHSTARDRIVTELEAAGFRLSEEHHFLGRQSFLVFDVRGGAGARGS
jgi:predicted methyltransferase